GRTASAARLARGSRGVNRTTRDGAFGTVMVLRSAPMQRSTDRILTTHTGSLPRPDDLIRTMFAKEEGVPVDPAALAAHIRSAVAEVVRRQAHAGLDVISDGEFSKPSYATYVKDRLTGFGGASHHLQYRDLVDFPGMARR